LLRNLRRYYYYNNGAGPSRVAALGGAAWTDQNIVTDWSAPTNGSSDARPAFLAFRDWAVALGTPVRLTLPAHTYMFHEGTGDLDIFGGIPRLLVLGAGATLTENLGTPGAITFRLGGLGGVIEDNGETSAPIETVAAGASSVTLVSIGDAGLFSAGDWVMVSALDLQGAGYPPNPQYFEYIEVSSVVGDVISFTSTLQRGYKSDFPVYDATSSLGGPATIYALNQEWNIVHEYRGFDVAQEGQTYSNGRSITLNGVSTSGAEGIIPTQNKLWRAVDCEFAAHIEADKMVERLVMDNTTLDTMQFQSASIASFEADGITAAAINGTPLATVISNSTIDALNLGATGYGMSGAVTVRDSVVSAVTHSDRGDEDVEGEGFVANDGAITRAVASGPPSWAVPGAMIVFEGIITNETGFVIADVEQDGSDVVITTDLVDSYPDIPPTGGAVLNVYVHPCPDLTFDNVTGCATAVDLSQAGAQGLPIYSYSKRTYTGDDSTPVGPIVWGTLVSLKVNVTQAYTGVQGTLTLNALGQFGATALTTDYTEQSDYDPVINLKIAGERIITVDAVTGNQSGDAITAPGAIWFGGQNSPYISADISGESSALWPIVSVEIVADQLNFTPIPVPPGNPYFENVSLLLHCDGADASTTFTDHSSYGHTMTANGNAQIDTAQSKFGGASGLFDGTGDYLSTTDAGEFDFGSGDFTVEAWIRSTTTGQQAIIAGSGAGDFFLQINVTGSKIGIGRNGAAIDTLSEAGSISADTWHHIAITRESSTVRFFLDGAVVPIDSGSTNSNSYSMATPYVGNESSGSIYFNGWMDDVRITKGVARYTAAFTPHTEAHPDF
jgi:hypothetical protein